MSGKHVGSSIDDFLKEEGIFEEAQAHRPSRRWSSGSSQRKETISKAGVAAMLKTSRSHVDRLLDPK